MVKENTHIFGASKILEMLDENLKETIKKNIDYYYIGSIAPDIFFFSEKTHFVSDKLHGKDGELTNEIIFKLLKSKDKRDLAFVFGYLTHCAFDIKFHPVIYYYAGNYYDKNKEKREKAVYLHRHFETYIDNKLKHGFLICKIIKKNLIKDLLFFKIIIENYKISHEDIEKALDHELFLNRLFKSSVGYYISLFITKLGISDKKNLGLFYRDLRRDKIIFEQDLRYKDIIDGKKIRKDFDKLFNETLEYGIDMINVAYKFCNNRTTKDQAIKTIDGKSLDTGKLRVGVSKIKYTL